MPFRNEERMKGEDQMEKRIGIGREKRVKYGLDEKDMPTYWYNILADLPFQMEPPLNPNTLEPAGPEDLAAIFPMAVI